jgi:hypothetical protein
MVFFVKIADSFSSQKMAKIAENCNHDIDPRRFF